MVKTNREKLHFLGIVPEHNWGPVDAFAALVYYSSLDDSRSAECFADAGCWMLDDGCRTLDDGR